VACLVRDAATRRKRFIAGVDPEKIRMNLAAQKEGMVEQESTYFAEIHGVEQKAKRIVEAAGVNVAEVAQYINIARKCYSLAKRFKGQTLTDEAQRVVNHWASRGYTASLASQVCNISGCGTSGVAPTPEVVSVPREYFEHAHSGTDYAFPADIMPSADGEAMWKCPSNWQGFSLVRLWFLGNFDDADLPLTVILIAGTCGEAEDDIFDLAELSISTTDLVFTCLDLTVLFEGFLSAVESCDLVQFIIINLDEENSVKFMGVEIVEATA